MWIVMTPWPGGWLLSLSLVSTKISTHINCTVDDYDENNNFHSINGDNNQDLINRTRKEWKTPTWNEENK